MDSRQAAAPSDLISASGAAADGYNAGMSLNELYQQAILAHNRTPKNRRSLEHCTHRARGLDALCGDDLVIELELDEAGTIRDAAWTGEACAVTTASASMLTEWLRGKDPVTVLEAATRFQSLLQESSAEDDPGLSEINLLRSVSKFPSRVRNALLPWETALDALKDEG